MWWKKLTPLVPAFAFGALAAGAMELPASMQAELRQAERGNLLALPDYHVIPTVRSPTAGPALLFCDMPEYLGDHNGVSLEENAGPGACRLYIYHVPGTPDSPRTVSTVVQNLSPRVLTVKFSRYGFPRPGDDYPDIGVEGLMQFFTGRDLPAPLAIPPGGRAVLDPKLDATVAHDPQLVHAFYEFTLDGPARIAVLQRDPGQSSTNALDTLPRLPRQFPGRRPSGAGRGLFPTADFLVCNAPGTVIDTAEGMQRLLLSDGRRERWAAGTDGLSGGITVTNNGNYGMIYHARLSYISSDGRGLALLVGAPERRYGGETRPKAAVEVSDGRWKGGWVAVTGAGDPPARRGIVEVVQEFPAAPPGVTNTIDLTYSPPGGSSLPTPIYLAPFGEEVRQ